MAKFLHSQATAEDELTEQTKKLSNIDIEIEETERKLSDLKTQKVQVANRTESLKRQIMKFQRKQQGQEEYLEGQIKIMQKKHISVNKTTLCFYISAGN